MAKDCVLFDKECDGCGECMFCDLDPTKICDNCGKCVEIKDDYAIKLQYHDDSDNDDDR